MGEPLDWRRAARQPLGWVSCTSCGHLVPVGSGFTIPPHQRETYCTGTRDSAVVLELLITQTLDDHGFPALHRALYGERWEDAEVDASTVALEIACPWLTEDDEDAEVPGDDC